MNEANATPAVAATVDTVRPASEAACDVFYCRYMLLCSPVSTTGSVLQLSLLPAEDSSIDSLSSLLDGVDAPVEQFNISRISKNTRRQAHQFVWITESE